MVSKTLGQYDILEPLGAGGMGEVYRAHDTNLKRDVAIKVLPEAVAGDPGRLARLEREAHSLAALNHPNVATIHGLESAQGIRFLVLELVEGDTLADWIAAGPVAVDDALRVAVHIAEGLEAAHASGIIHRDLKPANVKVTPEGRVKVLDFGLAKATDPLVTATSGSDLGTAALTHSPTITAGATEAGVLLGTAPYMSPEQAKAKVVDKRTDIWAFGVVLYEMLTGKLPFTGEDVSDTIASILKDEPDWEALPPATPAGVRSVLRRCLRKGLDRRLRDIGDVRIEIEDAIDEPPDAMPTVASSAVETPIWQRALPWAVAAAAILAAGLVYLQTRPAGPVEPLYSSIEVQRSADEPIAANSPVIISPDGRRVIYAFGVSGGMQGSLQLYDFTTGKTETISGTDAGQRPFFAPNGESIGFFQDAGQGGDLMQLKWLRLDGSGGAAVPLCDTIGWSGATWTPDGRIVYSPPNRELLGLQQVPVDRPGECEPLTALDPNVDPGIQQSHRWPQALPNGSGVLFSRWAERHSDEADIVVYDFESGETKPVGVRGTFARFVPTNGPDDGHVLFAQYETVYAVPFDARDLVRTGPPVPVIEDVYTAVVGYSGSAHFSVSDTGVLVYRRSLPHRNRRVMLVNLTGKETPLPRLDDRPYENARFSPDGNELILVTTDGEVVRYDIETRRASTILRPFVDDAGIPRTPRFGVEWDPDGTQWVVHALGGAPRPFFMVREGQAPVRIPSLGGGGDTYPSALLSDPARLLYGFTGSGGNGVREFLLDSEEERIIEDGPVSRWSWQQPTLSPDGRLLAYQTGGQVWVKEYRVEGPGEQVTVDGGFHPRWGPDSDKLYSIFGGNISVAEVSTDPLEATVPQELFHATSYHSNLGWRPPPWDLSPNGETFVMIRQDEPSVRTDVFHVIHNWFEVLRQVAPAQR